MNNTFKVISYEYIIWLYPFEQRVKGIKSSKSIMVVTNDGKTSNIVTVPAITKGRMEMFDEIFNNIVTNSKFLYSEISWLRLIAMQTTNNTNPTRQYTTAIPLIRLLTLNFFFIMLPPIC